jgi:two-component system response regulator HydG
MLSKSLRKAGHPLIAVVAGNGQIARCAVEAHADLILVLNAGLYRHLGIGSLASFMPYGNSNQQTFQSISREILPRAGKVPVIAGICGHDPSLDLDQLLDQYAKLGVAGVTNWPALGFVDGAFRQALEAEGCGEAQEIEILRRARARGLATFGFVLDETSAARFSQSGCEALILDMGLTRQWPDIHDHRDRVQRSISQLNTMYDAARKNGRDPLCLAFGGPIVSAEDFGELLRYGKAHGFAGGSVFERIPVEDVVSGTISRFKGVALEHQQHQSREELFEITGNSPPMKRLFDLLQRAAPADVNVCIEGESGTGKELVASALHRLSARANHPFVTLNCGAIPENLLESELFGHERGAFTGADRRRLGKFELAQGGTLFLDEVADLSLHAQVALLRAIQSREITRVGGEHSIPINVRIVTASHQSLEKAVEEKRFRADLYYRLNHLTIKVPALRDRKGDIPLLVSRILPKLSVQLKRPIQGVSPGFLHKLAVHHWPGNVRELHHTVTREALLEDGRIIEGRGFTPDRVGKALKRLDTADTSQKNQIAERALLEASGNKSKAAAALGITRKTLYAWLGEP